MANEQARTAAAVEAIFVRDGVALEGTHTNLFAVFRGVVRTSPLTNYILPGVTRAVVLELCGEAGFEVFIPPVNLCLDNAAMIAGLGYHHLRAGRIAPLDLDADPTPIRR